MIRLSEMEKRKKMLEIRCGCGSSVGVVLLKQQELDALCAALRALAESYLGDGHGAEWLRHVHGIELGDEEGT